MNGLKMMSDDKEDDVGEHCVSVVETENVVYVHSKEIYEEGYHLDRILFHPYDNDGEPFVSVTTRSEDSDNYRPELIRIDLTLNQFSDFIESLTKLRDRFVNKIEKNEALFSPCEDGRKGDCIFYNGEWIKYVRIESEACNYNGRVMRKVRFVHPETYETLWICWEDV